MMGSPKFDEYYQRQFRHIFADGDFEAFRATLLEKLPVTFRVNPSLLGHSNLIAMFSDPTLIERMAEGVDD